jgi:hypothetical protein
VNWKGWLYTLVSYFIGGASSALAAALALPQDVNWTAAGLTNAWHVAFMGGLVPALIYLKQSPLPPSTIVESATVTKTTTLE